MLAYFKHGHIWMVGAWAVHRELEREQISGNSLARLWSIDLQACRHFWIFVAWTSYRFQCYYFIRRAHFCKKTGEIQVCVSLSSFCDLVHIQNVFDPFAKQRKTPWMCTKSQKDGQHHKNTGNITNATNARLQTGDLVTLKYYRQLGCDWFWYLGEIGNRCSFIEFCVKHSLNHLLSAIWVGICFIFAHRESETLFGEESSPHLLISARQHMCCVLFAQIVTTSADPPTQHIWPANPTVLKRPSNATHYPVQQTQRPVLLPTLSNSRESIWLVCSLQCWHWPVLANRWASWPFLTTKKWFSASWPTFARCLENSTHPLVQKETYDR